MQIRLYTGSVTLEFWCNSRSGEDIAKAYCSLLEQCSGIKISEYTASSVVERGALASQTVYLKTLRP